MAQTTAGAACDVLFQQIGESSPWLRPEVEEPGWTEQERGDPEFLANQQLIGSLEYRCPYGLPLPGRRKISIVQPCDSDGC